MSEWFDLLLGVFVRRDKMEERKHGAGKSQMVPPTGGTDPNPRNTSKPPAKDQPRPSVKKPAGAGQGRSMEHLIVVGLDFGTAYTKCVVRDAMVRDPGKAYPVPFELAGGWSYLVPSVVVRQQTNLVSAFDCPLDGANERIDYLKMRLVSELDQQRAEAWRDGKSAGEMQVLVAWFIAQILARVGQEIHRRWPDFGSHPRDECFINICVPIAHADGSRIEQCLLDALCAARTVVGQAGTQPSSVEQIRAELSEAAKLRQARVHCYTYPETSANLQSYLKSRARQPGLYLFADVGAGTVDLSFFQLLEDTGSEAPLRYYHASVLDAGSSRLELKAQELDPELPLLDLIAAKEGRHRSSDRRLARALASARKAIHDEVAVGVGQGVAVTEGKLHRDRNYQLSQMKNIRLMHSGGGYSPDPYGLATQYFYRHRKWERVPSLQPLPEPDDIVWSKQGKKIPFSRLSVAYGLAFARFELNGHRFPSETAVNPDSPLPFRAERSSAPTKDEV